MKIKIQVTAACLVGFGAYFCAAQTQSVAPPDPPAHTRRQLDSAKELSRDLQETVSFLEQGQAYYREYKKGTHTAAENAEFLKFLQAYEREQDTAKKEVDALRRWVFEKSGLE